MTPEEKRWLAIGKAVERACRELPEGFDLHIELEKDAGNLRLYFPDTDASVDQFDADGFGGQIDEAINMAIEHSKAQEQKESGND